MSISSLVPVRMIDGVEAYVVLDKPGYVSGDEARVYVLLHNHGGDRELRVVLRDHKNTTIYDGKIHLRAGEEKVVQSFYSVPEQHGRYVLGLEIDGKIVDKTSFIVDDPSRRDPLYFTIVWHNHQAPNYYPDGKIHGPWAYVYVWGDHLKPYGYGPYHYHGVMLSKHPGYRATYNLSPSLLAQWRMLIEDGVELVDGRRIDKNSREAGLVRETISMYAKSLAEGRIDVLTSIYAHTIAGFLIDLLGMEDIVQEEIKYGMGITSSIFGEKYEPYGIWTPEMAFSMKLVSIYSDLGLKYTVLDDKHHLQHATGDKDDPYKPYLLIDPATNKYITVFFRDHELSDVLGFKNNFNSEIHAWRNAYEFSLHVLEKWFHNNKILVLALDGENWMVFSKTPPLTAYFLDKLIIYFETLDDNGYIRLSTLREIYEHIPARKILTHIPTNSWLGTFKKWRGEVGDHEEYWVKVLDTYKMIKAYERMIMGRDEYSEKARWGLWHALDSDYWWAEFWAPQAIDAWNKYAREFVSQRIDKVVVKDFNPTSELCEGCRSSFLVEIENMLDKEVYVTILLSGPDIKVLDSVEKPVKIKPNTTYCREIYVTPRYVGKQYIEVSLISGSFIVDKKVKEFYVKSHLPPNPV